MFSHIRGTRASVHLDFIRGVSAFAVLIYHIRYRFFFDFGDLVNADILATGWYTVTAFGHDAVMVFFVISGFLVGSVAIRDCRGERWSWGEYLTSRFVRLYMVLLPGLLLTVFWDRLGLLWFGDSAVYTGAAQSWRHDFFDVRQRIGLDTLVGNGLFLQMISFAPFGSNEALWSLSFEFWYYIIFPLFAIALFGRHSGAARIVYLLGGCALLYCIGTPIATYFPIWVLGVIVGLLRPAGFLSRRPALWTVLVSILFLGLLACSHVSGVRALFGHSLLLLDLFTAFSFAITLYVVLHDRRAASDGPYRAIAKGLADSSYTLYVVHLPLLVFLRSWWLPAEPWMPAAQPIALACLIAVIAVVYALAVARVTEARTAAARQLVAGFLLGGKSRTRTTRDGRPGHVGVAAAGQRADCTVET